MVCSDIIRSLGAQLVTRGIKLSYVAMPCKQDATVRTAGLPKSIVAARLQGHRRWHDDLPWQQRARPVVGHWRWLPRLRRGRALQGTCCPSVPSARINANGAGCVVISAVHEARRREDRDDARMVAQTRFPSVLRNTGDSGGRSISLSSSR